MNHEVRTNKAASINGVRELLIRTFTRKPVAERRLHNARIRAVAYPDKSGYAFGFKKLCPETGDVVLHAISLSPEALRAMVSMAEELELDNDSKTS
jgi:hypothetical protein